MKLLSFFLVFLSLTVQRAFSQITFHNNLSWEQVARKAKEEDKLIFILFESGNCRNCSDAATKAFSQPVTKDIFKKNFISLRTDIESEKGKLLAERFRVKSHQVALFVDDRGNILHQFVGVISSGSVYTYEAEIALKQKGKKQLSDYTSEYRKGQNSKEFLEGFIVQRRRNLLLVDELLDEYIGRLPIDSLRNPRIIDFVYQQGPTLDSKALAIIKVGASPKLVDSLFSLKSSVEINSINSLISKNTFEKAVQTKNRRLVMDVGIFNQKPYGKDLTGAMLALSRTFINYYRELKDTAAYLSEVRMYLDMGRKFGDLDTLAVINEKGLSVGNEIGCGAAEKDSPEEYPMVELPKDYHRKLNWYARDYFTMATKKEDFERALAWSELSLKLFKAINKNPLMSVGHYAYLNTYAQLLYKLDRKPEAIEWQTKAIEVLKATGTESADYERTLRKMKSGTL